MKLVEGMNEQRLLYFVKMEKIATSTVSSCCLQMIDLEKGEKLSLFFASLEKPLERPAYLSSHWWFCPGYTVNLYYSVSNEHGVELGDPL